MSYQCPHCQAGYTVVRVAKEGGKTYRLVRCNVCRGSMPAIDGQDILKYFLGRRPPSGGASSHG